MEKISKIIFEPYIVRPNCRPALEKPFVWKDYIVATDTYALLMIKKELLEDSFEEVKYAPNIENAIHEENCNLLLYRIVIGNALQRLPRIDEYIEVSPKVLCHECDGSGEVRWEYEDKNYETHHKYDDCPCCDGSGYVKDAVKRPSGRTIPDRDSTIVINGVFAAASAFQRLLDTMKSLNVDAVRIVSLYDNKACRIKIKDGIEFIFMPRSNTIDPASVTHINIMP